MGRSLITNVEVDGRWYGPGDDVPADVAAKITNPRVWRQTGAGTAERDKEDTAAKAGTRSGQRLARYVEVGGTTYGPDDPVPDDVAEKITNAAAWVDRRLPPAAEKAARQMASERTAATPPRLPNSGTPAVRAGGPGSGGSSGGGEGGGPGDGAAGATGAEGDGGEPPEGDNPPVPAKKAAPRKAPAGA